MFIVLYDRRPCFLVDQQLRLLLSSYGHLNRLVGVEKFNTIMQYLIY